MYTYTSAIALYHIVRFLLKILILREYFEKEKKIFDNFRNFSDVLNILKIRDSSFVALLILRHVI